MISSVSVMIPQSVIATEEKAPPEVSSSLTKKTIKLSNEKICHLIGANGDNLKLIARQCKVKIKTGEKMFYLDEKEAEKYTIDVEFESTRKVDSFDPASEWCKNLKRYLFSATRGGFVKKMSTDEYERLQQLKSGDILHENNLKIIEDQHNVEILYIGYNNLVYVCVLPRMEGKCLDGSLEKAISIIGEQIHNRYRRDVPLLEQSGKRGSDEKRLQREKDRDRDIERNKQRDRRPKRP